MLRSTAAYHWTCAVGSGVEPGCASTIPYRSGRDVPRAAAQPRAASPCRTGEQRVVKAQLIKRFEDEITELERELKTQLPKEIQRARELGDLRENAEYQAARERQSFLQARIGMLKKRVAEIQLMNVDKIPPGKVGLGSTVHVREAGGEAVVFQLVMPEDSDVERGWISTASPIGRALLNKEAGDEVVVRAPNGERHFEIVKLTTIHDE
jgi:transcription elongation factor GreA